MSIEGNISRLKIRGAPRKKTKIIKVNSKNNDIYNVMKRKDSESSLHNTHVPKNGPFDKNKFM